MILILHIIIATCSLLYSAYLLFSPSKTKINISYSLIAATFASGTILIVSNTAHMLQACLMGLMYLAAVSIATIFAQKKLAREGGE